MAGIPVHRLDRERPSNRRAKVNSPFEEVYEDGRWGSRLGSGHGSLPRVTGPYRAFIQDFIRANDVKSVLDYGCGDWQFSRLMDWQGASYVGVDVVPGLIDENQRRYGREGVEFRVLPEDPSGLPPADLLVAKDVLQHLPNEDVTSFLATVAPRYRMALLTNDTGVQPNVDISIGDWRPLDLLAAPFEAHGTVVAVFRGPKVRSRNLRRRASLNAWTKHTVLLRQ